VPALASTGQEIHESFSDEWAAFGTELSKTWGQETEQRLRDFQEQLGYLNLEGKRVWDAGCGAGLLSNAITTLGCDVVASDISDSVFAAARRFADNPRLTFVQADLARPVFQPESFDVIFCAGVLHHTPDTRKTLEAVLPALKPGGTIFVWLYWAVPGWKFKLRSLIRSAVVPMPLFVRKAVSYAYVPLVALKGRDGHSLRELAVVSLDYFTPKYRHEHTPEELGRWFRELGLSGITTSETGINGFGVRATLPLSTPLGVRTTRRATA
jgi:SAM-dependent methyltransferase